MDRAELLSFLRRHRLAVQASVAADGAPQAAVIGVAVTDALELVFDTLATTRKHANLRADDRIALVVGWDEVTAQIEGRADFPEGDELARIRALYLEAFPDGHDRLAWPGICHVRVRPRWVRVSDFRVDPPRIVELTGSALVGTN